MKFTVKRWLYENYGFYEPIEYLQEIYSCDCEATKKDIMDMIIDNFEDEYRLSLINDINEDIILCQDEKFMIENGYVNQLLEVKYYLEDLKIKQ